MASPTNHFNRHNIPGTTAALQIPLWQRPFNIDTPALQIASDTPAPLQIPLWQRPFNIDTPATKQVKKPPLMVTLMVTLMKKSPLMVTPPSLKAPLPD
jgi:hypothetical protein